MKRILAHRPSPAMGVALVALFVALGGVSYGFATGSIDSREIADNSIRSKDVRNNNLRSRDLRNNDIRSVDIRNRTLRRHDIALDTLTGNEIRESKLDQVPSAALADRAADADRLGGLLPSDFARSDVGDAIAADLATGVTASGGDYLPPGYWKDPFGVVRLQGTVTGVVGDILSLPTGYRPAGTAAFEVPPGVTVVVESDGTVRMLSGPIGATVSLDGLSFRAG